MFSIRTTVVMTAFVAAGLASAAEYLVAMAEADEGPFMAVESGEAGEIGGAASGPGLGLDRAAAIFEAHSGASPWI